jgi:prevent-host-death family protein
MGLSTGLPSAADDGNVNLHQAKNSLPRLVERALAGEDVVIARNGEPLVRLVTLAKRAPRVPGRSKGRIWIAPDFLTS